MHLIDTHVLIWALLDSNNLSEAAKDKMTDGSKVYVSIASLWEIAIKQSINKLNIKYSIEEVAQMCVKAKINISPIDAKHLDKIKYLPSIHSDPFDRLIIAQSMTEGMDIITKDGIIPQYDVITIW